MLIAKDEQISAFLKYSASFIFCTKDVCTVTKNFPVDNYLSKVDNRNIGTISEICLYC